MQLAELVIEDFGPIEHLRIEPKAVTVISGGNDRGKTSVLRAVASAFVGGHNPADIRRGAKRARVLMRLDDGTEIERTLTAKTSNYKVTSPDGREVKEPATYLRTLASGVAFDPVRFLGMKPKEQAEAVLSVMPVTFAPAEIEQAFALISRTDGEPVIPQPEAVARSLNDFGALVKSIREDRTTVGRVRAEAEKTYDSLRKALPPEPEGGDWDKALRAAEEKLATLEVAKATEEQAAQSATEKNRREVQAEYERNLEALNKWRVDALQAASDDLQSRLKAIHNNHATGIREASDEAARLKDQAAQAQRAQGAREQLEVFRQRWGGAQKEYDQYTTFLEKLDDLKASKLKDLPIEGLSFSDDGQLLYGGLPLDSANTAGLILLAVQVACLSAGPLGLMILDRAESLDPDTWEMFVAEFRNAGFQILTTRVTEGERRVETFASA